MQVNAIKTTDNLVEITFYKSDYYCQTSNSVTGEQYFHIFENNDIKEETTVDIDNDLTVSEYVDFLSGRKADVFADTMDFQKQYGLWDSGIRGFLESDKMKVKIGHMEEELNELKKAYENGDLLEFCDGVLDLIYVAAGCLNLMNMPVTELWNDIHLRNMNKVRATTGNTGKRGSTFDVIKPEGWAGPRTSDIISHTR